MPCIFGILHRGKYIQSSQQHNTHIILLHASIILPQNVGSCSVLSLCKCVRHTFDTHSKHRFPSYDTTWWYFHYILFVHIVHTRERDFKNKAEKRLRWYLLLSGLITLSRCVGYEWTHNAFLIGKPKRWSPLNRFVSTCIAWENRTAEAHTKRRNEMWS